MKTKDIIAMIAVLAAGGCASNDEVQQKDPVPIRLTASVSVEAKTRSVDSQGEEHVVMQTPATRGVQETAIASGEKVYVWGQEAGSSSWTYLQAWDLTSDGSNNLSGTQKYYPLDGSTLTMAAVHGNFAETLTEGSTAIGTLTHSVEADQETAGNYEKSDLLWGTASGSDGDVSVNIPFTHKLSKIEVTLTPGYGYTTSDLATAEVRLHNVKPSIGITTADGTLGSASGDAITITPRNNSGVFEAIIPSQTFTNPDGLISVTTNNLTLTPPARLTSTVPNTVATFEGNTKYQYSVTVDKWTKPAHVGDYFYADGNWSTEYESGHGDVVGLVFSTETSDADRAVGFVHGYVVALQNQNTSEVMWSTSNFLTGMDVIYSENYTDDEWIAALIADMDGLSHTNYLKENYPAYASTFPALNAALSYTPVASKTIYDNSGWFLPSTGQLYAFLNNFCTQTIPWPNSTIGIYRNSFSTHEYAYTWNGIGDKTATALYNYFYQRLNTDIVSKGGSAVSFASFPTYGSSGPTHNYWTSTEFSASGAYMFHFGGSGNSGFVGYCDYDQKTYFHSSQKTHVRAILAF